MAFSLRVASCFLFCAAAIQDVVHIHRQASQFANINDVAGRARDAVDKASPLPSVNDIVGPARDAVDNVVDAAGDAMDKAVDATNDAVDKAAGATNDVVGNAMGALDAFVTQLDATVKTNTVPLSGAAVVSHAYADHAEDIMKENMIQDITDVRPLILATAAAELVTNDTAQTFNAGVEKLETQVTGFLNDLSAVGLESAQKALTEVDGAMEPLHKAAHDLGVAQEGIAVAADESMDAKSVQAPLGSAVNASVAAIVRLTGETSTNTWIGHTFDAVLEEASTMPNVSVIELAEKARKAEADTQNLVNDLHSLEVIPVSEVLGGIGHTQAVTAALVAMTPSAAEGSRCFSAAVGGVVLMALTAANA